jgi:excinuclease ABC subunit C
MIDWFRSKTDKKLEILTPKRGDKLKLIAMVRTNAQYMLDELKLQRLKREFIVPSVQALKRDLRLTKLPRKIECFDISNIQGTDTVASMVVFFDGKPRKTEYRKYKLITALNEAGKPDDFASMREVIFRRYRKIAEDKMKSDTYEISGEELIKAFVDKSSLPDLIVIDGGKGQLSSAVTVLNNIGIKEQNIIGLAKRLEEVFVPGSSEPQSLPKTSSGLKLLQRVRNEAHRFAITFHRQLRDKRILHSELDDIKGIGEKTRNKLLNEFGSVEIIKEMIKNNYDDFEKRAGKKVAEKLKVYFGEI